MLGRRSTALIGLDVGSKHVKAAQLARSDSGWRLVAASTIDRVDSSDLSQAEVNQIADVLGRQGFKGGKIVLAVPDDQLLSGILDLPPRDSGAPIEQLAKMELARTHKCDASQFEVACWDLPPAKRAVTGTQVMAAGCIHEKADELLDMFEAAGLTCQALDVRGCATVRACEPLWSGQSGVSAILDLGWSGAVLLVVYRGVIVYQRTLSEGGIGRLHELLCGSMELDDDVARFVLAEVGLGEDVASNWANWEGLPEVRSMIEDHIRALGPELRTLFSYIGHRYPDAPIEQLLMTGGGAKIKGLVEHLGNVVDCKTMAVFPEEIGDVPVALAEAAREPAMVTAIGLALFTES